MIDADDHCRRMSLSVFHLSSGSKPSLQQSTACLCERRYTYHRDGGRSGEVGGGNADGTRKHRGYFRKEGTMVKGIVRGGEEREGREKEGSGRASCVRREKTGRAETGRKRSHTDTQSQLAKRLAAKPCFCAQTKRQRQPHAVAKAKTFFWLAASLRSQNPLPAPSGLVGSFHSTRKGTRRLSSCKPTFSSRLNCLEVHEYNLFLMANSSALHSNSKWLFLRLF